MEAGRRPRRPNRRPATDKSHLTSESDGAGIPVTAALVAGAGSSAALTTDQVGQLQRTVGNAATTQVIQRDRATVVGGKRAKQTGGQLLSALMAPVPGIAAAMSYDKLAGWQKALEVVAFNEEVNEERAKHDSDYRRSHDNMSGPIIESGWRERDARIAGKRKYVTDPSSLRAPLDMDRLLEPDVLGQQQWNVVAENKFRGWLREHLASQPWVAELTQDAEIVPGYLINTDPKMAALSRGGVPHVRLKWGGYSVPTKDGRVTWDEVKTWPKVAQEYKIQVTGNLAMWDLGIKIPILEGDIEKAAVEHQDLIERSKAHPVVRWLSEQVSTPSMFELASALRDAKANPDDQDAQARLFALQLKYAPMPGIDIWTGPREAANAAAKYRAEGKYELAAALYAEADRRMDVAAQRFYTYEGRVMSGAATIVTWLNRAKSLGKMASMFTGAGGLVRTAAVTAGYSFAQEGAEQVVAHWIDPMNKIDVGGLAKQSAIEGLMAVVGGVTQGAFMKAIATRYGTKLVQAGLSVDRARQVMSASAAMTAGFYNVPARIVLDSIIAGKAVPTSVAEISDMVATEAFRNAAMDVVGGYVHASGQKPSGKTPAAPSGERFTLADAPTSGDLAPTRVVDGLIVPVEAGRGGPRTGPPGSLHGPPVPISAEARALAAKAESLKPGWEKKSLKERAQALVDLAYKEVEGTGLHKPTVDLEPGSGGHFRPWAWRVDLGKEALMDNPSEADWAHAVELARHEVQHALDWFRAARRQDMLSADPPHEIAQELDITIDAAKAAAQANKNKTGESMAPGSVGAKNADVTYESVWGTGRKHRDDVLTQWEAKRAALKKAANRSKDADTNPYLPEIMKDAARNDWQDAHDAFAEVDAKYRELPEEILAYEAGRSTHKAVLERPLMVKLQLARGEVAKAAETLQIYQEHNNAVRARKERISEQDRIAYEKAYTDLMTAMRTVDTLRDHLNRIERAVW